MLEGHGLQQHIKEPTHIHGHTLDVFITRQNNSILEDCPTVLDPCLCDLKGNPSGDHFAIKTEIRASKPKDKEKEVTFRRLRAIPMDDLIDNIQSSAALNASHETVNQQTDAYNSSLRGIINKLAPPMKKKVKGRPIAPWYTDDIQEKKRTRRKAERMWIKSGLEIHRQIYKAEVSAVNCLIKKSKQDHYSNKISECGKDSKKLFNIAGEMMGSKRNITLPQSTSQKTLAENFNNYFAEKITSIRDGLTANSNNEELGHAHDYDTQFSGTCLDQFAPTTEQEVKKILSDSQSKSCELDPLPTDLLKKCIDPLLPCITSIINKSLETSTVPDSFKEAVVRPLLKKPNLTKKSSKTIVQFPICLLFQRS